MFESAAAAGAIALKLSGSGAGAATVASAATDVLPVVAAPFAVVDAAADQAIPCIDPNGIEGNPGSEGHAFINQVKEMVEGESHEGLLKVAAEAAADVGAAEESQFLLPFLFSACPIEHQGVLADIVTPASGQMPVGVHLSSDLVDDQGCVNSELTHRLLKEEVASTGLPSTATTAPMTTMSAMSTDATATELLELAHQKVGIGEEAADAADVEGEEAKGELVCKAVLSPVASAVASAAAGQAVSSETGICRGPEPVLQTSLVDEQFSVPPLEEDSPAAVRDDARSSSTRSSAFVAPAPDSMTFPAMPRQRAEEVVQTQKKDLQSSRVALFPQLDKVLPTVVLQAIDAVSEFSCNRGRGCNPLPTKRQKPLRQEAKMSTSAHPEGVGHVGPDAPDDCNCSDSDGSVVWV